MSRDLLDLVRELNTLNDDNLADRVIANSDVQWCLSELQDILEEMPTLTPPNEPERAGLYGKYSVYKNKDGSQVTDCFVLRPDKDPAAVVALTAYATATDNAELAADIRGWIGSEPNEPLTPCDLCRYNPPSSCDGKPCCMCPAEKGSPEGEEDRK
jgi:hypothetical protein